MWNKCRVNYFASNKFGCSSSDQCGEIRCRFVYRVDLEQVISSSMNQQKLMESLSSFCIVVLALLVVGYIGDFSI